VGSNVGVSRLSEIAHRLECSGRENDLEVAAPLLEQLKSELERVMIFLSRPDWIEIAKREKVVTDEEINVRIVD